MGRRKPAPPVPPTKAQIVERKTLQLGELRFERRGGRRNLGAAGPRGRLWERQPGGLYRARAPCLAHAASPFRCFRYIDNDIRARALIFRLTTIDPEPALAQARQRGPGGMGKPAHCSGQLVDRRAALAS